jgi:hypothetical protein
MAEVTQAVPLPLGDLVIEPTGQRVQFVVADVSALEGGLVKRKDSYVDALGSVRAMQSTCS